MAKIPITIDVEDRIVNYLHAKGYKIVGLRKPKIGETYFSIGCGCILTYTKEWDIRITPKRLILEKCLRWPDWFTTSYPGIENFVIAGDLIKFNYWDDGVKDCGFEGYLNISSSKEGEFSDFKRNFLYKKSNF